MTVQTEWLKPEVRARAWNVLTDPTCLYEGSEITPGESLWKEIKQDATELARREQWYKHIKLCGYPILFARDIELICEALPDGDILSVGSGSGYVEWCFAKHGGRRVIATDPRIDDRFSWAADWMDIIKVDSVSAVRRYRDAKIMMVSWACRTDGAWDFEALTRFRGDWLVYIGESPDESTSSVRFFEELEAGWDLQLLLPMARVPWLNDMATVFRRRQATENP